MVGKQQSRKTGKREKWELSGFLHLAIISNWDGISTCFLKVGLGMKDKSEVPRNKMFRSLQLVYPRKHSS